MSTAHARGAAGEVRIGSFGTAMAALVAPVAGRLHSDGGDVLVRAEEVEAAEGFQRLESHELDLVISMEAPGAPGHDDPRLHRVDLLADRLDALLPALHPLAGRRRIALGELATDELDRAPRRLHLRGGRPGRLPRRRLQPARRPSQRELRRDDRAVRRRARRRTRSATRPCDAARGRTARCSSRSPGVAPARHLFAACRRGAEGAPVLESVIARTAGAGRRSRNCATSPPHRWPELSPRSGVS